MEKNGASAGSGSLLGEFCVYEHWRPDTGRCFYVGKGTKQRAFRFTRQDNQHYARIIAKLKWNALKPEVRIIADDLDEAEAFLCEMQAIAAWRQQGVILVNKTNGGEGASGCIRGPELRARISASMMGRSREWLTGRTRSPEHRAKIGRAGKGRVVSKETKAKISAAQKGKLRPELYGRKISPEGLERMRNRVFSDEHRRKISEAKKGRRQSPEHIAAAAAGRRGKKRPREAIERVAAMLRGRSRPLEVRAKISAAHKGRKSNRVQSAEERRKRSVAAKTAWARRKALPPA